MQSIRRVVRYTNQGGNVNRCEYYTEQSLAKVAGDTIADWNRLGYTVTRHIEEEDTVSVAAQGGAEFYAELFVVDEPILD